MSVVACGDRLEEALVMIKSVLMFRTGPLTVHIFADDMRRPDFKIQVQIKLGLLRKKVKTQIVCYYSDRILDSERQNT